MPVWTTLNPCKINLTSIGKRETPHLHHLPIKTQRACSCKESDPFRLPKNWDLSKLTIIHRPATSAAAALPAAKTSDWDRHIFMQLFHYFKRTCDWAILNKNHILTHPTSAIIIWIMIILRISSSKKLNYDFIEQFKVHIEHLKKLQSWSSKGLKIKIKPSNVQKRLL